MLGVCVGESVDLSVWEEVGGRVELAHGVGVSEATWVRECE